MSVEMPRVRQIPTPNYTPSLITHDLLIAHMMEGGYAGSVAYLCLASTRASAHLCLSEDGSEVTQLVPLQFKAWAQCAFNGRGISLEIPGFTAEGVPDARLAAAARIFGWLARAYGVPPVWAKGGLGRGVCSHHDLGAAGGGHVDICGVGDATWMKFMALVKQAHDAFGDDPLPPFALHGLPNPHQTELPPGAAPEPSHGGAPRAEAADAPAAHPTPSGFAHGSVADLQWRLNRAGAAPPLRVDGLFGEATRAALEKFQATHGCKTIDGRVGPESWAALDRALGP